MQQLTDKELKMIAANRAWKENRTVKKGLIIATALFPFLLLDMWLIYAKHISSGWGLVIFALIMVTLWTLNYFVRKEEMKLTADIFKRLKDGF